MAEALSPHLTEIKVRVAMAIPLTRIPSAGAPYLRTEPDRGFGGLPWFSEYGVQQTRGFRALKLWMTLQHLGRDGVRGLVGRHIALAQHLAGLVDAAPDLERLAPVELSIVCFRYAPAHLREDDEGLNALNKQVMEEVQASGTAFLTQTTLHPPIKTPRQRLSADQAPAITPPSTGRATPLTQRASSLAR